MYTSRDYDPDYIVKTQHQRISKYKRLVSSIVDAINSMLGIANLNESNGSFT